MTLRKGRACNRSSAPGFSTSFSPLEPHDQGRSVEPGDDALVWNGNAELRMPGARPDLDPARALENHADRVRTGPGKRKTVIRLESRGHCRVQVKVCVADPEITADPVFHTQASIVEDPTSHVQISSRQSGVPIVSALDHGMPGGGRSRENLRPGPPCNPKPAPHLAGILLVQRERIVSGSASLAMSLVINSVPRGPRVHDQTLSPESHLEAQRVCMTMTGKVIGTEWRAIAEHVRRTPGHPAITTRLEDFERVPVLSRRRQIQAPGIS